MSSSGQSSCTSYATHVPMYFFNAQNNLNGPPKPPARKRRPKTMFRVSFQTKIQKNKIVSLQIIQNLFKNFHK